MSLDQPHSAFRAAALADWLDKAVLWLGAAFALYHFVFVVTLFQGSTEHYITHISGALALCAIVQASTYLRSYASAAGRIIFSAGVLLVGLAGLVALTYMRINAENLENYFPYFDAIDIPFGYAAIAAIIVLTWLHWGPTLPLLTLAGIAYFYWGHLIPKDGTFGALTHQYFEPYYVLGYLGLSPTQGFIGWIIPVSANFIFLFMIFGRLLVHTGSIEMFMELGKGLGNLFRAGPAYTATAASALVGMVTGTAAANIVLTGSVTIPTMKAAGFKARSAAAIETVASAGGQILPPIMGAAAFIMAQFVDMPYVEIARRGILPAILYFIVIAIAIHFLVQGLGVQPSKARIARNVILTRLPVFLVPLLLIIMLLVNHHSPMYAATYGTLALLVCSLVSKQTRPDFATLRKGLSEGAVQGAQLAVVLSCVGIFSQVIITTGLGNKLGDFIVGLTDGTLLPTLVAAMVICVVLGVAVPTAPAYILTALAVVPALAALKVDLVVSNFFVFYFAILSTITPPIAIGVFTAARLAGAPFLRTSLDAFRLALIVYILPFAFVYHPGLLNFPFIGLDGVLAVMCLVLTAITYNAASYGHFKSRLCLAARLGWAGAGLLGLIFLLGGSRYFFAAQAISFFLLFVPSLWHRREAGYAP